MSTLADRFSFGFSRSTSKVLVPHDGSMGRWVDVYMSNVQNPGWLFDIGDYITQLYGDYNKLIQGSLKTNQLGLHPDQEQSQMKV